MNLSEETEAVTWPETHYVYIEKAGPFDQTAPQAWKELHQAVARIAEKNSITGFTSLFKMKPDLYRAGVSLAAPPVDLPEGVHYARFPGGAYARFVYTGPYSGLHEAYGRVTQMVAERKLQLRDDYNIEHYPNDPKTTPEDRLITEILFPTAG